MMQHIWTSEWPTEEGWYWAYGVWWDLSERLELEPVHVWVTKHTVAYVAKGTFIYPSEEHKLLWQRIPKPELPEKI
jgi:hypothetical protein